MENKNKTTIKRQIMISLRLTPDQNTKISKLAKTCHMRVSEYILARGYNYFPKAKLTLSETNLLSILSIPKTHFDHLNNAYMLFSEKEKMIWENEYRFTYNQILDISSANILLQNFFKRIKSINRVPRNCRTPLYIELWIKKNLKTLEGFEEHDNYLFQVHYQNRQNCNDMKKCVDNTERTLQTLLIHATNTTSPTSSKANAFYSILRANFKPYELSHDIKNQITHNLKIYANIKQQLKPRRSVRKNVCVSSCQKENIKYTANLLKTNVSAMLIARACDYTPAPRITYEESAALKKLIIPHEIEDEINRYTVRLIKKSREERIGILKNRVFFKGLVERVHNLVNWLMPFLCTQTNNF